MIRPGGRVARPGFHSIAPRALFPINRWPARTTRHTPGRPRVGRNRARGAMQWNPGRLFTKSQPPEALAGNRRGAWNAQSVAQGGVPFRKAYHPNGLRRGYPVPRPLAQGLRGTGCPARLPPHWARLPGCLADWPNGIGASQVAIRKRLARPDHSAIVAEWSPALTRAPRGRGGRRCAAPAAPPDAPTPRRRRTSQRAGSPPAAGNSRKP